MMDLERVNAYMERVVQSETETCKRQAEGWTGSGDRLHCSGCT